ncbi:MAG: hypothetical protein GY772_27130 [bacterium]|nr:hypothetical protein [bacterium]
MSDPVQSCRHELPPGWTVVFFDDMELTVANAHGLHCGIEDVGLWAHHERAPVRTVSRVPHDVAAYLIAVWGAP